MDKLKQQLQLLSHEERKELAFWLLDEVIKDCGVRSDIQRAKALKSNKNKQ